MAHPRRGSSQDKPWPTSVQPACASASWSPGFSSRPPSASGTRPSANWDLALFAVLLAFSVFSYLTAVDTESKVKVSGTFLALVLAMVFLGGTPAALIGVVAMLVGWLPLARRARTTCSTTSSPTRSSRCSAASPSTRASQASGLTAADPSFYLLVFALFQFALVINFVMIAGYGCYVERAPSAAS